MGLHTHQPSDNSTLPPIVLLVEADEDTREMYSLFLESSGMWVATAPDPGTAAATVVDLKPDIIVSDVRFNGEDRGLHFARALKHDATTAHVPVVLLSGQLAAELGGREPEADLFLLKPVLPDDLLSHISFLLKRSRELRGRAQTTISRAAALMQRSNEVIAKAREIDERLNLTARRCPACGQRLQWVETGRIDGVEYDYYHWCDRGCGLYCYDCVSGRWVKLAG